MMKEENLKKYYDQIIDKVEEIIPVKWTKVLLYANATEKVAQVVFYFYTEDGKVHYIKDITRDFLQNYDELNKKWEELGEITKAMFGEYVASDEPFFKMFTMELLPDGEYVATFGDEKYAGHNATERGMVWVYEKYGIIIDRWGKQDIREIYSDFGKVIPDELYYKEKEHYFAPSGESFPKQQIQYLEEEIAIYNAYVGKSYDHQSFMNLLHGLQLQSEQAGTKKFLQAMVILRLAHENRKNYRGGWTAAAQAALYWGDKEIARELVCYAVKQASKGDVDNANHEFIPLKKEGKDEHVADIIGMVIDELGEQGPLTKEQYDEILTDFAEPVLRWRSLEVPKYTRKGSYELITQLLELCLKHKAYVTALRLSGLLYIADTTKEWDYFAQTCILAGKITYELGFLEVAKQCFLFAVDDTDEECLEDLEAKYKELLGADTKLEVTDELCETQKYIEEIYNREDVITFTKDELDELYDGKIKLEPYGLTGTDCFYRERKVSQARNRYNKKAMKKYEACMNGTPEEKIKGIEKAFSLLLEEPEVHDCGVMLYTELAKIYMEKEDYDKAYEYYQKAYNSKDGKCSAEVLLGFAKLAEYKQDEAMATAYLFRAYVLAGKEFLLENAGSNAWEKIKKYIPMPNNL